MGVPDGIWVRNSLGCNHWYSKLISKLSILYFIFNIWRFFCRGGQSHAGSCTDNFLFSATKQACVDPSLTDCTDCAPFGQQNIQLADSCTEYVRCSNGIREIASCPHGIYFNSITGQCDASAICHIPTVPTTTVATTEDPWATTTEDPSATTTEDPWATTTDDPWGTTTENPWETTTNVPSIQCTGTQIFHAHPTNCRLYYTCFNNQLTLRECPSNLYWNQLVNACDIPENTICFQRQQAALAHAQKN